MRVVDHDGVSHDGFSVSAHKPQHHIDTDVDGFPLPSASVTRTAHFNARLAIPDGAETVAFGYPARALVFEQRVRTEPLAIRDMRRR
jgi:hypothetical protein